MNSSAFGMGAANGIANESRPLVGLRLHTGVSPVPRPFGSGSDSAKILRLDLIGRVHWVPNVDLEITIGIGQ